MAELMDALEPSVVGLVVLVFAKTWEPEGLLSLKVTHVYEDGCADVYDNDLKRYKFYCEEEF